ncbi:MAG: hypothetical protein RR338_00905 [Clostridia bacterium]
MEKLDLYEQVRAVPEIAQKTICAGRLKGMTDINPMWRIKVLTEQFGICGIGWKIIVKRTWLDDGANGEVSANVEIELFVKQDETWSEAIPGIGGSKFVSKESSGLYTDDECYKKAYTDAMSVACKALGIGADVYWEKDSTKYTQTPSQNKPQNKPSTPQNQSKWVIINNMIKDSNIPLASVNEWIMKAYKSNIKINDLTEEQFTKLIAALNKKLGEEEGE